MKQFFASLGFASLLIILLYSLSGCSTISYTTPTGSKFSRTRFGQEDIKGLKFTESKDSVDVTIESASHDPTDTINALASLSAKLAEGVASGAVKSVK